MSYGRFVGDIARRYTAKQGLYRVGEISVAYPAFPQAAVANRSIDMKHLLTILFCSLYLLLTAQNDTIVEYWHEVLN